MTLKQFKELKRRINKLRAEVEKAGVKPDVRMG